MPSATPAQVVASSSMPAPTDGSSNIARIVPALRRMSANVSGSLGEEAK